MTTRIIISPASSCREQSTEARELTLYFVGYTLNEAINGLPFDSIESAESYAQDEGGDIYSVPCYIPTAPGFYTKENP
jgi:hypothetical protein